MKTLYLCEKPSQARDIAAVLKANDKKDGLIENQNCIVTWCLGHLLELANPDDYDIKYKKWSFDTLPIIPSSWRSNVTKKGAKQFKIIKQLLSKTDHVVISTDPDREGEVIGREVLELCRYRGRIERLWLSSLDRKSIEKALINLLPDDKTKPLYYAGIARGRADWLMGINLTRAYTLLSKQLGGDKVVSVGRVQTPTLNLIVQRDYAIETFTPVAFFDLVIDCDASSNIYQAKWLPQESDNTTVDSDNRCLDSLRAQEVADSVRGQSGNIIELEKTIKEDPQPLPFDLSSLQIEASKRYGIDADDVLNAAQSLYETHKATTYPRTDCRYLALSQFDEVTDILSALKESDRNWYDHHFANTNPDFTIQTRCWNDKEVNKEAHPAIIPTTEIFDITQLTAVELKVYILIRQNFVFQFFKPYRFESITCKTQVKNHKFLSTGKSELDPGWRILLKKESLNTLPASLYKDMEIQVLEDVQISNKFTKPPERFTSGSLIAAMKNAGRFIQNPELRKVLRETSGIGTNATRASIIVTLRDRSFIQKKGKFLISTDHGRKLIKSIPDVLKDPGTTALWEQVLDDIANSKSTLASFMAKQSDFVDQMILYLNQQLIEQQYETPSHPCPNCGKALNRIKSKKKGSSSFWGCSDYPVCKTTLPDKDGLPGSADENNKKKNRSSKQLVAGQSCPECSTGNLSVKTIKGGNNQGKEFIGCSNYPKCKAFTWN